MQETAMRSQSNSNSWLNIKKDFNTMTWVLMPVAIAINIAIGQIVVTLKLPVYLDSIGTVLVGVICGPWAGALTGALANTILGLTINPDFLPGGQWQPSSVWSQAFAQIMASSKAGGECREWLHYCACRCHYFSPDLTSCLWRYYRRRYFFDHCLPDGNWQRHSASCICTSFLTEPVDKITLPCWLSPSFRVFPSVSLPASRVLKTLKPMKISAAHSCTLLSRVVVLLILFAIFLLGRLTGG